MIPQNMLRTPLGARRYSVRHLTQKPATRDPIMTTPKEYFDDAREADLADRVWQISATLPGKYELHSTNEWFASAKWPWVNRRMVYARDWITNYRESDGVGGIHSVNAQLGGTDFTAAEIGNVEHFYVAAMTGSLGGPVGGVALNVIASVGWELVIGPIRIAAGGNGPGVIWQNIKHNASQVAGPDQAGMRFGSFYSVREAAQELLKSSPPLVNAIDSRPPLGTHPVKPNDWLSKIADKWYHDMYKWPIIYDANSDVIGKDPNKIKPGQILTIPDLADYTTAGIADAVKRGKAWKKSA